MKKISLKKSKLIFTSLFLTSITGYLTAQIADPPKPTASVNTCDQTLTSATPPSGVTYYWQGTSCGTGLSNSATTYTASASGTYYLRAYGTDGLGSMVWSVNCSSIDIVNANQQSDPPAITVNTPTCGAKTLTLAINPPAGVTYYWQGTTCGSSTTSPSSSPYAITNNTTYVTYYLRAKNDAGCWSINCSSINTIISIPCNPPAPTTTVNKCDQTLTRGIPPTGETYYWQGTTCDTNTAFGSAATYTASASGTYYIRARNNFTGTWSAGCDSITITNANQQSNPPAIIENIPSCGTKNLTTALPPAGVTYYWQGTTCGTSTTSPSSSPYAITNNTTYITYYLRAKNDAGCWSLNCSSINTIISTPCDPPAPTATVNNCDQTLTGGVPPTGETYYWQGTTCGTNTAFGSAATYTASASGTYYIRARNNFTDTWSAGCESISITNANQQSDPPAITVNTPTCGAKTLTAAAIPPAGVTYYWQGTSCGTSITSSSASPYTVSNTGTFVTYYLRAKNNAGCWSLNCSSVKVYNYNPTPCAGPANPSSPTVSTNICGNKTLTRGIPPVGIGYYWQGTSCGTSITDSAKTYIASTSGTYYLRAKEDTSTTWSAGCASITVTVPIPPATPATPSISTNTCGVKILTRGTPPVGETYYWQGTSCDNSTLNSALTDTASVSGTYYLISIDSSGCWSACSSVSVTVDTPKANAGQDDTICNGSSVTLNASGGTSYLWSPSTGLSNTTIANPVAKPITTTTYTVTVTSGNCSATDTVVINVDPCIGVMENIAKKDIFIYPNPSNGIFTIQNNINAKLSLNVTNMIGETIYQEEVNDSFHQVNLTHLPYGIYFIKLQSDNMNTIQKISIQRTK